MLVRLATRCNGKTERLPSPRALIQPCQVNFPVLVSSNRESTEMKYFSQKALDRGFKRPFRAYQKQLAKLEGRVSRQAWNFFAFGFRRWGLHDARLLAVSV